MSKRVFMPAGLLWLGLACAVALGILRCEAQLTGLGTLKGFGITDYFDGANFKQMKFQISGAEVQPVAGTKLTKFKGAKLQRYNLKGETEIIVETPECLYDSATRAANSPEHLKVRTGDGRLIIEGDGFLWQERESLLTISNHVRAEIRRPETNSPPIAPMVITSHWFQFDVDKHTGMFHEDIHGSDPQTEFTSGNLIVGMTASTPTNRPAFDRLIAEPKAYILNKTNGSTANADRIIYSRGTDTIEMFGHAAWKDGTREGLADHWIMKKSENTFSGDGKVAMKLPREATGLDGFFDSSAPPKAGAGSNGPPVNVFADRFQSWSNFALTIAEGAVRVVDTTNQLACNKLTLRSTKGIPMNDTAVAEGNVVVTQGEHRQLRAPRADYAKANELIVFTGRPEWNLDSSEGRADRLTVNRRTREFHAQTNVTSKVTMGGSEGTGLVLLSDTTQTNKGPHVIELFGDDLRSEEKVVKLTGHAHAHQSPITGSEPRLRSESMELRFGTNQHTAEIIRALNNVVYEQGRVGMTNGPDAYRKMTSRTLTAHTDPKTGALATLLSEGNVVIEQFENTARSDRATYTSATDILELTGKPTLETPQVVITEAQKLVWDKTRQQFITIGTYQMKLRTDTMKSAVGPPKIP